MSESRLLVAAYDFLCRSPIGRDVRIKPGVPMYRDCVNSRRPINSDVRLIR